MPVRNFTITFSAVSADNAELATLNPASERLPCFRLAL